MGSITPTIAAAGATATAAAPVPTGTVGSLSSAGAAALQPSSAWNMDGSFELFGKKAGEAAGEGRALNQFTLELTGATTMNIKRSASTDTTAVITSAMLVPSQEQEQEQSRRREAQLGLATQRMEEDDDVVMESEEEGEEEEERGQFGVRVWTCPFL